MAVGRMGTSACISSRVASDGDDGAVRIGKVAFLPSRITGGVMASAEPIIVVLGPLGGGTSAVASVLHHLGVFMGTRFDASYRELHQIWEDAEISALCRRAITLPSGEFQMEPVLFQEKLRTWADEHRRAAHIAGLRPGVKHPLLCLAVDLLADAWGPFAPVVVERPFAKIVATLNRLDWFEDERERAESMRRLIAARDLSLASTAKVRVDFEELRANPVPVIRRLADELGLDVTHAQVEAATNSIVGTADMPRDVDPFQRFIDQLLPAVERNPDDAQSVSLLAQVYFDSCDYLNARKWFARKIEIGCQTDEETFVAMLRVAQSIEELGADWHEVQEAYLSAWEFRPTRAEPLYCIAKYYFNEKRYQLGYLFAERAARIPLPDDDMIVPYPDIYAWRAADAQAKAAFCIGEHTEAFTLWRFLLGRPDIPDYDRQRIVANRDQAVPAMLDAVSSYPDTLARNLIAVPGDPEVTVSLIAGPDLVATQQTLNSFLNCCGDVSAVGRFLMIDGGLSDPEREMLSALYEFLEFAEPGTHLAAIREEIKGRFWLHLGQGWCFFAPENLITRLTAVLGAETQVLQVGINLADAVTLTATSAPEATVRRTPDAGRYVLTDTLARGPAMFDTARLDQAGGVGGAEPDPIAELARRAAAAGLRAASLDEVLCITAG
jgi:tetratricopeptide (TPR) repeat protein